MSKNSTPNGNMFTAIFCHLFGHRYVVSKKITHHIKEYKCIHCKTEVTTNASGNLSMLTPELQDINNTLQDIYSRRRRKVVAEQQMQVA